MPQYVHRAGRNADPFTLDQVRFAVDALRGSPSGTSSYVRFDGKIPLGEIEVLCTYPLLTMFGRWPDDITSGRYFAGIFVEGVVAGEYMRDDNDRIVTDLTPLPQNDVIEKMITAELAKRGFPGRPLFDYTGAQQI